MKKFLLIFIVLFACFYGMSFVAVNSKAVDVSDTSKYQISTVSVAQQSILSFLNGNEEDPFFETDVDRLTSDITVLKEKSPSVKKISKCNKSSSLLIDKKSVLKVTPFKSDIEFCNVFFKDGVLSKMAAKDISSLSTAAMESIHQTSLITLQSFLF
jgi:hypothetical protein